MRFRIVYHPAVVSEDISKLSATWKLKIRRVIERRLTSQPDLYGKPLRKSLKGYRKLRVGDYGIFRIDDDEVKGLMIAHRAIVYTRVHKRL